ncbi:MAG: metalloendopeptidase, partial [Pseudomonadota bacterium]
FSFVVLLVAVMQMYVVVARSFFGRTLGEWTFDLQMGNDEDIESPVYPLKIVFRSLITVATGLVTLSFLSFVMRTDIAAKMTGIQLYRHR